MSGTKAISQLTAAGALVGTELLEISQLSTSVTITATTLSAQASDNSYNDSGNGFVAAGFVVGDRVKVTGFTGDTANNIVSGTITVLTTGKMTIGGTDGDVIVDDAAGESVTITKWVSRRVSEADLSNRAPSYELIASEALSAGNLINVHASSGAKIRKANATATGKRADGFILAAIANGASGRAYLGPGLITGLSSLTPGAIYYLDTTGGGITATAPSAAGNVVQEVGIALSATELLFAPQVDVELS